MRLTTFGSIELEAVPGAEQLLSQPKLLSLFVYLVFARRGKLQRRDRLAGMFWGDQSEDRARASLRTALSTLRSILGDDLVLRRGDAEVGIDIAQMQCDAFEFSDAIARDELALALELYRGPFLEGLFPEAAAVQHWLDDLREGYRTAAADAAWTLAERYESQRADLTSAARWARRAAKLAGADERRVRRVMQLLVRAGDAAGAIAIFTDFSRYLKAELDLEPSVETQELAQGIRART